jgi:hypothetical protein
MKDTKGMIVKMKMQVESKEEACIIRSSSLKITRMFASSPSKIIQMLTLKHPHFFFMCISLDMLKHFYCLLFDFDSICELLI